MICYKKQNNKWLFSIHILFDNKIKKKRTLKVT